MGRYNWFHYTDVINLDYQKFRYVFMEKYSSWFCYSLLDSRVIGKRYLRFLLDISELQYKLRIGKETNWQNSIFASLSSRLTGSF